MIEFRRELGVFASVVALLASGCSVATAPNAVPQTPASVRASSNEALPAPRHGRMVLTIHIPKRVRHKNHYVSPLTQSLSLSITPGAACATCSGPIARDISLTPSSPNCTGLNNGTTCSIILVLNPGNYIGTISTYDGPVGCQTTDVCNTLSTNQSFPLPIAAGRANVPSIALYGVPKYLKVAAVSGNVSVDDANVGDTPGIFVAGINAKSTVSLYAADAGGESDFGSWIAVVFASSSTPLGWSATVHGNLVTFATGATFQPKNFVPPTYTITAQSPACSVAGATCSFDTFLFVAALFAVVDSTNGEVHVYFPDASRGLLTTYATVTTGLSNPTDVKFNDANGDLFVSNAGSVTTVTVYAPPYTGAPIKTISVPAFPTNIALDKAGDLAVASTFFVDQVNVYAAPGYGSPQNISLSNFATALAFGYGANPALWVASSGSVAKYAPPYNGAANPNLSIGNPAGVDLDPQGNIYVTDSSAGTISEYVASSAYSLGLSTGSLAQASSVDAGPLLSVCAADDEYSYYYGGSLQLGIVEFTETSLPCFVKSDYTNRILVAANFTTFSSFQEANVRIVLPFLISATATYPSYRFSEE